MQAINDELGCGPIILALTLALMLLLTTTQPQRVVYYNHPCIRVANQLECDFSVTVTPTGR